MQKSEFTVKVGDTEQAYYVSMPSGKQRKEAREYKDRVFKREMLKIDENGKNIAVLSNQVYNLLKTHGVWTDEKEARVKELTKLIDEKIRLVSKGKSEAIPTVEKLREVVVKEIKPLRSEQFELLGQSRQMDNLTVESLAAEAEIDYLVAHCTFTSEGELVYSSLDDYYGKTNEPYTEEANIKLQILIGNINPNWIMDLPENKILKKYNLIDDKGNYIVGGVRVNSDGHPINEKGYRINAANEQINEYGDRIDDEGNILDSVDFEPVV